MQEVLEKVCKKQEFKNPSEYALLLSDGGENILIPLDRTVRSLQGKKDLLLVKQNMLDEFPGGVSKAAGRTTDPNGEKCFFLSWDLELEDF